MILKVEQEKGTVDKMKIDRKKAIAVFDEYVSHYNVKDEKVKLKIYHTYRVSELCEKIAGSIGFDAEDVDLAWLSGLLHDVGRFEQLRNFGTFNDAISIDHAGYGADILFRQGLIRKYVSDTCEDELLEQVIRCHSAFAIPKEYDERTVTFAKILRDADKIDILRVNVEVPLEEIYNVTTKELYQSTVTCEVLEAFMQHTTVLRSLKKTPVDNVVGHISLAYGLEFPISRKLVKEQGYLEQMMHFASENDATLESFSKIREEMNRYLAEKS